MTVLDVKGVKMGEGRAKTIVSLMDPVEAELLASAKRAVHAGADCVEWRADFAQDVHDPRALCETGLRLLDALPHTPLVFTLRSEGQGGRSRATRDEVARLLRAIIDARATDLIDIESSMGDEAVHDLVGRAHAQGIHSIVSHHDFTCTPSTTWMAHKLKQMASIGAHMPKLAVMARSTSDCLRLMEATAMAHDELETPLITMAMGAEGALSRLAGEAVGSALTFCALEKPSAPGQVGLREATLVLDGLHRVLPVLPSRVR
jgi:3-dehydroquinate dehydratase-1